VAAARADHLANFVPLSHAVAPIAHAVAPVASIAHGVASQVSHPYAAGYQYSGPLAGVFPLIAHPNGAVVPVDEPAVAAARADHLSNFAVAPIAHAVAPVAPIAHAVASPVAAVYDHGYHYSGPLAGVLPLISHPNGAVVPVDEPAVAAARADHLASHGVVPYGGVYAGLGSATYAAGYAPYAGLIAHPNGAVVPIDEPAVAAARADHLAAHGLIH